MSGRFTSQPVINYVFHACCVTLDSSQHMHAYCTLSMTQLIQGYPGFQIRIQKHFVISQGIVSLQSEKCPLIASSSLTSSSVSGFKRRLFSSVNDI